MNPAEVIEHVVQSHGMSVVFYFLAKVKGSGQECQLYTFSLQGVQVGQQVGDLLLI
jgi:hypothetical protein